MDAGQLCRGNQLYFLVWRPYLTGAFMPNSGRIQPSAFCRRIDAVSMPLLLLPFSPCRALVSALLMLATFQRRLSVEKNMVIRVDGSGTATAHCSTIQYLWRGSLPARAAEQHRLASPHSRRRATASRNFQFLHLLPYAFRRSCGTRTGAAPATRARCRTDDCGTGTPRGNAGNRTATSRAMRPFCLNLFHPDSPTYLYAAVPRAAFGIDGLMRAGSSIYLWRNLFLNWERRGQDSFSHLSHTPRWNVTRDFGGAETSRT